MTSYRPDHTPDYGDEPYDASKIYHRYVVEPGWREDVFDVYRRNSITGQGWHIASYNDESAAHVTAYFLNDLLKHEHKS
jgi:hypothetical protein